MAGEVQERSPRLRILASRAHGMRVVVEAARARLPGHRRAAVMDSGMGGNPNLKAIDSMKPRLERVSVVPLRNSKAAEALGAKGGPRT